MKLLKIIFLVHVYCIPVSCQDDYLYVNIFIHGTTRPYLNLQNIISIWKQYGVEKSAYATITRYMRKHGICKYYQAMQDLGLEKIDLKTTEKSGAAAIANLFDYFIKVNNPRQHNKYFTFGWSGILGTKARKRTAKKLYRAILRLQREAKIKNKKIRIRIIDYSHGGTVALNLGKINRKQKIAIYELINLGMPVQYDTDYLINSPIFENIYHFYSMSDYVQAIDHISSNHFACHKRFAPRKGFSLPKKLKQIQLEVTKTIFSQYDCPNRLPLRKKIFKAYHLNPGHSELWGLGWTPNSFRETFPLYPIPVVAIVPIIIHAIKELEHSAQDITADVKPGLNKLIITEHICKHSYHHTFQFIPKAEFENLKKTVIEKFKPPFDLREANNAILQEGVAFTNQLHNLCDFDSCRNVQLSSNTK